MFLSEIVRDICHFCPALKSLAMANCGLPDQFMEYVFEHHLCYFENLESLDLSDNDIVDIYGSSRSLTHLCLAGQVNLRGIFDLEHQSRFPSLRHLDLSRNHIWEASERPDLPESLPSSLTSLNLAHCALFRFLPPAAVITWASDAANSLRTLDLSGTLTGPTDHEKLFTALPLLIGLKELYLAESRLGKHSFPLLVHSLAPLCNLEVLDVASNVLQQADVELLLRSLERLSHPNFELLLLGGNLLSEEYKATLRQARLAFMIVTDSVQRESTHLEGFDPY